MLKIGIRTNRTRSAERPPLLVHTINDALLAKFGLLVYRRVKKPAAPVRKSREGQPEKRQRPANQATPPPSPTVGGSPLFKRPPYVQSASSSRSPAPQQSPLLNKRVDNRPPTSGQTPPKEQPAAGLPSSNTHPKPDEPKRPESVPPERPSTTPLTHEVPERKLPPAHGNGNGVSSNGMNGNGKSNHNNTNGNGIHGAGARSSIFNSSMFTSYPSSRVSPKGSANLPMQVPMEIPLEPTNGHSTPPINGKKDVPEPPQQPPRKPDAYRSKPDPAAAIDQLLKRNPAIPNQSAILGAGEDGLPVLLDLYDPAPGALLITGDEREEQLEMLRTAVVSLAKRNSPRGVQFLIISWNAQSWKDWIGKQGYERYCLSIEGAEDAMMRERVLQLADWTEQRRLGQRSGPPIVVIMDTLSFLPRLEYDVRLNFDWMAKEGPAAQIWPVAAISFELAKSLSGRRLLRGFQTRVFGCAAEPKDYVQLAGLDESDAANFGKPGEFAVRVGENWLRFRLPGR